MKTCKKLIFPLILFLSFSCSKGEVTSTSSDVSSSSSSQEVLEGWQEPAKSVLSEVLKEYADIPYFEADTYYAKVQEVSGVNLAVINCFDGFDTATAEFTYTLSLKEEGYTITDAKEDEGAIYATKIVKEDELAVVLQYAYIEEYKEMQRYSYFAIVGYLYENQTTTNPLYDTFPTKEVEDFLGVSIPAYDEARQYEVAHDVTINQEPTIDIYCYQSQDDAEEVYKKKMEDAGFTLEDIGNIYIASKENSNLSVWFYMSYDNLFVIRAFFSTK